MSIDQIVLRRRGKSQTQQDEVTNGSSSDRLACADYGENRWDSDCYPDMLGSESTSKSQSTCGFWVKQSSSRICAILPRPKSQQPVRRRVSNLCSNG